MLNIILSNSKLSCICCRPHSGCLLQATHISENIGLGFFAGSKSTGWPRNRTWDVCEEPKAGSCQLREDDTYSFGYGGSLKNVFQLNKIVLMGKQ